MPSASLLAQELSRMHPSDEANRPIRVLVVDNRGLIREGLRHMLDRLGGVEVLAGNGSHEAISGPAAVPPIDVVLIDAEVPGWGSIAVTQQLRRGASRPKVVILSVRPSVDDVASAVGSGATGFLLRDAGAADLELALHSAVTGEVFLCPSIFRNVLAFDLQAMDRKILNVDPLGVKSRRILNLLADGFTIIGIARHLAMGVSTVIRQRREIMGRLGIDDADALIREAVRLGVLSFDQ